MDDYHTLSSLNYEMDSTSACASNGLRNRNISSKSQPATCVAKHAKGRRQNGQLSSSISTLDETWIKRLDVRWWSFFIGLSIVSLGTRVYKLDEPDHICWDETHFGKMGSWYINGTFFFDVHPPLGKMLIGLAGHLSGYNGSYPFSKPGDKYGDTPYMGMRLMCASLGASLAPLSYCVGWELSKSYGGSVLAASLVIFDTGVLTLSQYILLDPILMFFIMASTFCLLKFQSLSKRPFSFTWWLWLSSTGLCLACSIGVKFVGLFVILLAGCTVSSDMWRIMGNLQVSMGEVMKHLLARAACLIALPILVYMALFFIHFRVLIKSGNGDGFFSSSFQSQLHGNALHNTSMPQHVAYGSVVTLKNHRTAGAYLHSHWHLYPDGVGARQQQVTTYSHKDENNHWLVKHFDVQPQVGDRVELVKNGDLIRLEHVPTHRNLHSHREIAPLSKQHYQVTGYGLPGAGDLNDVFRLSITGVPKGEPLTTVRSVFRLLHYNIGCALQSHNKQLPKWGWEQMEVTCNPKTRDKLAQWNIEEVIDHRLPNTSFDVYSPTFLEKLMESHAVMTQGNKGLKPKEGEVASKPWQWPMNYKGQPFSGGDHRVYLLGNPVIWWGNLLVLGVYCLYALCAAIRHHRVLGQISSQKHQKTAGLPRVVPSCGWLLLGWALHYLPFWTMTRVLYFHHYFPAFLYSSILTGIFVEYLIDQVSRVFRPSHSWMVYHGLFGILLSLLAYSFVLFSPLSYGMHGVNSPNAESLYAHLKWLPSWDI